MPDSEEKEALAEALDALELLERMGEQYGSAAEWGALGVVRRLLRRQALTLELLAAGLGAWPEYRWAVLLKLRAERALWSSDEPEGDETLPTAVPEKPVPRPGEKTPVPDDHIETIRAVEHGDDPQALVT